jgi:hypothetical protein
MIKLNVSVMDMTIEVLPEEIVKYTAPHFTHDIFKSFVKITSKAAKRVFNNHKEFYVNETPSEIDYLIHNYKFNVKLSEVINED